MYWSAGALTADVPPVVVTVTSTVPTAWAGAVTVIVVALLTVMAVPAVPPKLTVAGVMKLVPVRVTTVPAVVGPASGLTAVTVGGLTYVNWSAATMVEVPPMVVTVMSTVPAEPAGATAVMEVAELTMTLAGRGQAEQDRGPRRELGPGQGHRGAAADRPGIRVDETDRGRAPVGELVGRDDGRLTADGRDPDVGDAGRVGRGRPP